MPAAPHDPRAPRARRPDVRIVVTSRAPLRIGLEQEFPVGAARPFRRHRPLRGARPARQPIVRADGREPQRGRRDLQPPRRAAAWDRARGLDGSACSLRPRSLDQLTRRLDLPGVGSARPARSPANAHRRHRVELLAARRAGAAVARSTVGVRRRVPARGARSRRRAGGRTRRRADRRAVRPRRAEPRRVDPRTRPAPLSAARDDPALRRGATRRTRRDVARLAIGTPVPTSPWPRKRRGTCRAATSCHGSTG